MVIIGINGKNGGNNGKNGGDNGKNGGENGGNWQQLVSIGNNAMSLNNIQQSYI